MKKKHKLWFCTMVVMTMFMTKPMESIGSEIQSVETEGSIGFTGTYQPIGMPEPTPPESIEQPPIEDVAKPDINLPQTNSISNGYLIYIGIVLIALSVLRFKQRKQKHDKTI